MPPGIFQNVEKDLKILNFIRVFKNASFDKTFVYICFGTTYNCIKLIDSKLYHSCFKVTMLLIQFNYIEFYYFNSLGFSVNVNFTLTAVS